MLLDHPLPINRTIGVVLDISLRHASDGRRILDHVKKHLIDFFKAYYDDDDIMYLYHPDIIEPVFRVGSQISAIANYETDGWKIDLNLALKQTFFVLEVQDPPATLLLITDRLQSIAPLKKIATLVERNDIECDTFCMGIGPYYTKEEVPGFCHVHWDSPETFFLKELVSA